MWQRSDHELARETSARRRAECLAQIQTDAVQLALDLLVREPDIEGFFGGVHEDLSWKDARATSCGVWLIDEDQPRCDFWMAYLVDRLYTRDSADWDTLKLPRETMAAHLFDYKPGWSTTVDLHGRRPAAA